MAPKENGAPAIATQDDPDRTKLNAAKSIEPSLAAQANSFRPASIGCQSNPRTVYEATLGAAKRLRIRFLAARIHALGPSPLAHFVREIEARADVFATLEIYAALPRDFIVALGGDQLPPALHTIDGGRS